MAAVTLISGLFCSSQLVIVKHTVNRRATALQHPQPLLKLVSTVFAHVSLWEEPDILSIFVVQIYT